MYGKEDDYICRAGCADDHQSDLLLPDGTRQEVCPTGQMACVGKDAVPGDGVLRRPGRRAGNEGISPQDEALVFQGVFPGVTDIASNPVGNRRLFFDEIG